MSEQEEMWRGKFGDEYTTRNQRDQRNDTAFFAKALARTHGIKSILEIGAGDGSNLGAISRLLPDVDATAIEINKEAAEQIQFATFWKHVDVHNCSIFKWKSPSNPFDLVLTKGLLIHIPPRDLRKAYARIVGAAGRYILLCEYYAPTLTMIPYRGENDRLWKGDLAGELLEMYPKTLRLLDYGFTYRRDPNWPQDDLNWFLLEVVK